MIRFLTAGESHGQALVGILEGIPAGLPLTEDDIAEDLRRRQLGFGRGDRMKIERDRAQIMSGVRFGETIGSPISLLIENRDWSNWRDRMRVEPVAVSERPEPVTTPRPGHADFAGAVKYGHADVRNVLERSSARETAMRVALAAICRRFFAEFGISVCSHVTSIGGVAAHRGIGSLSAEEVNARADENAVRCLDPDAAVRMTEKIKQAKSEGDTLGGSFEVVVFGLPVGLGSHVHWDRRLDGLLASALMSIQAIKSAGIGIAHEFANLRGSEVHDRLYRSDDRGIHRRTNRAGGVEGGMSTGEPVLIQAVMKPLSSLSKPLDTIDITTGGAAVALRERSDVCAVPAAAVVGEAMTMLALMNPFLEKFGGDSIAEIRRHIESTPPPQWT